MGTKKILITGGAGFVGSHLSDALVSAGHDVRVFDNLAPQVHGGRVPAYLARDVELVVGDMRDSVAVHKAIDGVDVIFHLAAAVGVGQSMYQIADYIEANTQGTANLLQAILDRKAHVERLIVASSMSIYGEGQYSCENCGDVAPSPRRAEQLQRKLWEMLCLLAGSMQCYPAHEADTQFYLRPRFKASALANDSHARERRRQQRQSIRPFVKSENGFYWRVDNDALHEHSMGGIAEPAEEGSRRGHGTTV